MELSQEVKKIMWKKECDLRDEIKGLERIKIINHRSNHYPQIKDLDELDEINFRMFEIKKKLCII